MATDRLVSHVYVEMVSSLRINAVKKKRSIVLPRCAMYINNNHRSDNQTAVQIIANGSRRPHLQEEAMRIFLDRAQFLIKLTAESIPREENTLVDDWSKVVGQDYEQVNPRIIGDLNRKWGLYTVDCFSSLRTNQQD